MATPGGSSPPPPVHAVRESRWRGQGYADITKLRELAAKHERLGTRNAQRSARIQTKIEKLRHQATVLREKAQQVLQRVPDLEQEIAQHEREIKAATERTSGIVVGSDVTNLHYRNRKLQQRIVDLQHKSRTLEHRAAMKTQKAAELKIKADRFTERSKLEEGEAQNYRRRADRLQLATDPETTGPETGTPAGSAPPPA